MTLGALQPTELAFGLLIVFSLVTLWLVWLGFRIRQRTLDLNQELDDRRRIESELRLSEGKYRTLLEQASDGIFVADGKIQITEVNQAALTMFGYTLDELKEKTVIDLVDPEDLLRAPAAHEQLERGESVVRERVFVRKDGSKFYAEINARMVGPDLYLGILRDLTTRKITEARLKRINEDLERRVDERTVELQNAYDELESFSYSVAHDLRAPLRAMNGYATIVLREHRDEVSEEARALLERISVNAKKMGQLIDSLLGYARTSRIELHQEDLSVAEIGAEAWKEATEDLDHAVPRFEIVGHLPRASADPNLLKLLLYNLFENATKFSRDVPDPSVQLGYDDEVRAYFVKDNGVGFDPQFKHKLFGVFERLHTAEFEGTGVGLAIVKRISNRHGGDAWAEGSVGQGATFWFTLDPTRTLQEAK